MNRDDPVTAGIDIGSLSAQAVILKGGSILSHSNIVAGGDRVKTANKIFDLALETAGLSRADIRYVVGTGYGRFQVPYADKNVTEITCHARGANYFFPGARTVLDMGGQDCKAIRCDKLGRVTAFVMNDKCAAGTGRSMEVISKLLGVPLTDIGPLSLDINGAAPHLSSVCVVFAKSEALQMIRRGVSRNEVLAAYCEALAGRAAILVQRVGIEEEFVMSGGVAKNVGVVSRIESKLGLKANICHEPQIVGAVGAALIAFDIFGKSTA
jgi:benzoyl-CoA reductase subunit A